MQVNIQPVTFFKKTATVLNIHGVNIRSLGQGGNAFILCSLMSANGEQLHTQTVELSGTDYDQWGTDDSYIADKVVAALELTRA